MTSTDADYLESFCSVEPIGQDLVDKISRWAQDNLSDDEIEVFSELPLSPDMSGETALSRFTEVGIPESRFLAMLRAIGFSDDIDSDDSCPQDLDVKRPKVVSERLSEFLSECVLLSKQHQELVKEVEVKGHEDGCKEEVRFILDSAVDLRTLPSSTPLKKSFMDYLHSLREVSRRYSMIDEAFCFNKKKSEFIIALKHYGKKDI